jgi:hypothetical protein
MAKHWDVFISYASEDGELAERVSELLVDGGLTVWIDFREIHFGERLMDAINRGLARSSFGILLLSKSYLSYKKIYTKEELEAITLMRRHGRPAMIPIWHDIDRQWLAKRYPTLAGHRAIRSSEGVESIAAQIVTQILNEPDRLAESTRAISLAAAARRVLRENRPLLPKEISDVTGISADRIRRLRSSGHLGGDSRRGEFYSFDAVRAAALEHFSEARKRSVPRSGGD